MVSERQSGKLGGSPLQSLCFPTMAVTENGVKKKLKIKFCASKKVEAEQGIESCKFSQQMFKNDECGRNMSSNGNKKSEMNKAQKIVIRSSGDLYSADSLKVKLPIPGSNKRGPSGMVDGQMEKRQKIDRTLKQQCSSILKMLMTHRSGWVFNKPVDPLALNIPDYFSIIAEPMDLGTIKTKLEGNVYFSVDEFEADVRLTFSNAMLYNPPSNNVHHMAKELDNIFGRRWKLLEEKWNCDSKKVEQSISSGRAKNNTDTMQACHKSHQFGLVFPSRSQCHLRINKHREKRMEAPTGSLDVRSLKVESKKATQNGGRLLIGKFVRKGTDSGSASAGNFATTEPHLAQLPPNLVR
ncbi:unnamed protein product, partial [Ilex paraguariensis]